jgi:hypothetical protein
MSDGTEHVFQASDLGNKRVEVLEAARNGLARVRDKDGTSLVMLPERELLLLQKVKKGWQTYMTLEKLLQRSELPRTSELGEHAWLRHFDRDDLQEFSDELHEVIVAADADGDAAILDECLRAWRTTARQLEDPLRRSILLGPVNREDYVEASEPNGEQ